MLPASLLVDGDTRLIITWSWADQALTGLQRNPNNSTVCLLRVWGEEERAGKMERQLTLHWWDGCCRKGLVAQVLTGSSFWSRTNIPGILVTGDSKDFFLFMCAYSYTRGVYATCLRVPMETRKALDPLELELQAAVPCLTWVLGMELWSSGRAVSAFNHWAVSPAPATKIYFSFIFGAHYGQGLFHGHLSQRARN